MPLSTTCSRAIVSAKAAFSVMGQGVRRRPDQRDIPSLCKRLIAATLWSRAEVDGGERAPGGETTAPKGWLPKTKCKPPSNKPSNVPRKPSPGLDSLAWGEPRVVVIESSALATSLDREHGEPCIDDARSSGVAGRAGGGGAGPTVRISRGYHAACGYAAERKEIVLGSLDAADRGALHRRYFSLRRPCRGARLGSRSSRCRGVCGKKTI